MKTTVRTRRPTVAKRRSRKEPSALAPDSLTEAVAALARCRMDAEASGDTSLVARCDAAGAALVVDRDTCLTCNEPIKPGMVRVVDAAGARHVAGALVCRKGGPT